MTGAKSRRVGSSANSTGFALEPDAVRLLDWGTRRLRTADAYFGHGTTSAREEAAWLLAAAIGARSIRHESAKPVAAAAVARYRDLIEKRGTGRRPAAYLLQEAWFAGRRFYVDERVLVPRSLIGESILERFSPWITQPRRIRAILDLGTGSGCIALALARAFPWASVDASDISADALAVAAHNVRSQRLQRRVHPVKSDVFSTLQGKRYDLIVSNPPYATEHEFRTLPKEYRYEPKIGLVAPGRGLAVILKLLAQAPAHLDLEGLLVVETGNRARALQRLLPSVPFLWLADSADDGSVFLLDTRNLRRHHPEIVSAARSLTRNVGSRRRNITRRLRPRSDARSRRA